MSANNTKSNKWCIVVNAKKETPEELIYLTLSEFQSLLLNCNGLLSFVATIIHDKDNLESGERKRTHLHAYVETTLKYTKKALLELLSNEVLKVDMNQVSIEPTNSELLSTQYLVHKNDPSKYQYSTDNVATTDIDRFRSLIESCYQPPKTEIEQLAIFRKAKSITELINLGGLAFANKFRNLFKDYKTELDIVQDYDRLQKCYAETISDLENANAMLNHINSIIENYTKNCDVKNQFLELIKLRLKDYYSNHK